jgi:hypothetical protein
MRLLLVAAMTLAMPCAISAQAQRAKSRAAAGDRDQLGMTCAQILAMSSADWVAHFDEKATDAGSSQEKVVRAAGVYGKCYDARTDRLAASLGRKGSGPPMGARANFRELEQALQSFTTKALAANDPPADVVKTAYAGLYEKQFRYEFYKSSEEMAASHGAGAKRSGGAAAQLRSPNEAAADSRNAVAATPTKAPTSDSGSGQSAAGTAAEDADPMSMAKNHFGELLDALSEDKMHELHSSFGDIVSRGEMSEEMRLAVYQYAIFVLEPATAQPFSAPPF